MLLPAQVLPFLQHEDEIVRNLAIRYLTQSHDPSPATAENVWQMIDRFGPGGQYSGHYAALSQLPHTESSLTRTLKELESTTDKDRRQHLETVIQTLQYGLLIRFRDTIEGAPGLSDTLKADIAKRFELISVSATDLWDQLAQLGEVANEPDFERADRLTEALSRSPEAAQWAIAILEDKSIDDLRRIFSIELLGRMRHRPAARLLVDQLTTGQESDHRFESSTDALIRVGGTQVVELIRERYPSMSPGVKLYASDVLSGVKLREAENLLVECLKKENEPMMRTKVACALCDTAANSPEALELLREMVNSGKWDLTLTDLDADVTGLFTMVGHHVPELPRWRAQFSNEESRKFARAKAMRKLMGPEKGLGVAPDSSFADWDAAVPPWQADQEELGQQSEPAAAPKTIRRETAKVGRNDPCPCGSGKKYKKCCGK